MITKMMPNSWLIISAITLLLLTSIPNASPSYEADKIKSLPGQPRVNFQQYAGYINVDQIQQRNLFYYFVEAEINPSFKPLVLWLTGGPGASSVGAGAFGEHGPFRPSKNGNSLVKHDYSWNKEANMLYVDSPAGVGFSYSANSSFYNGISDEMTAKDNMVFLQNWVAKFPEYRNRDLFIAGDSYGGHFAPQLANLVLQSSLKSNLKGVALGNPVLEFKTDFDSTMEYLWSHGLISDSTYELSQKTCNYSQFASESPLSPSCALMDSQMTNEIGKFANTHDVLLDVCSYSTSQQAHVSLNRLNEEKVDVCILYKITQYMNRKDVQKAMNAHLVGVSQWSLSSTIAGVIKYQSEDLLIPTLPLLGTFIKAGVRVLVYSGDQDSVIPLTGTRTLINQLAKHIGLKTTVPYRSWLADKQVGGWTQVYGDILTYATVRGAAHVAPLSHPSQSLILFRSFLNGKQLPNC